MTTSALARFKSMDRSKLKMAYSGKHGCMCGCLGNYYVDKDDGQSHHIINPKQVNQILARVADYYGEDLAEQEGFNGEAIFHVDDKVRDRYSRNYVVYFHR